MTGSDATTVSAYDLLPDEDRKAIAWVREMGGVNALSRGFQDADNRRIELCSSLGIDLETGWADAMVAMRRRLMPEGMEWPKHTDGELVRIGGCWGEDGCDTSITYIERIIFAEDGVYLDNEYNEAFYRHGERVKRPAPKVLDADGEEIREGDVLYRKSDGRMVEVAEAYEKTFTDADGYVRPGDGFTHRAPVFAADGMPLREGEHVYHVETGAELVVKELPKPGEYQAVVVFAPPASHPTSFDPNLLTHRAPVLAADGEPLEVGQMVYTLNDDMPYTVKKVETNRVSVNAGEGAYDVWRAPTYLTHERPVLDADGVPIKVGDTVYFTDGREQECNTVVHAKYDYKDEPYVQFGRLNEAGYPTYTNCSCIDPSQLTHTKPEPRDSWERIEEDALLPAGDYRERHGMEKRDGMTWPQQIREDLVRRCRALAERGE